VINALTPLFVESVPQDTLDGILYISIRYSLVIHRCCCGCGKEVTTKLSPSRWSLIFDGDTASLTPSIGNWDYPCRSHYWIWHNEVRWARRFSDDEIEKVRRDDIVSDLKDLDPQSDGHQLPQPPAIWRPSRAGKSLFRIFTSKH
jgi:hypothetical protein